MLNYSFMRFYAFPFARRFVVAGILLAAFSTDGCCTYSNADHDPNASRLLGHRCVVLQSASFPQCDLHWLPSFDPPNAHPDAYRLVALEPGTVIRVVHVEKWFGPIDPTGSIVFGDVQNGPKRGTRLMIGEMGTNFDVRNTTVIWCVDPTMSLSVEAGHSIRPLSPEDEGVFYTADFDKRSGSIYNLVELHWSDRTATTGPE